ncbi:MAG: triacylglycerol lipase [Clostridia bacterium]|nr:triacylglycerol lipase [Clostridia bacterium]
MSAVIFILDFIFISVCANCLLFCIEYPLAIPFVIFVYFLANIIPSFSKKKFCNFRIRVCYHGNQCLKVFLLSVGVSIVYHIVSAFYCIPGRVWAWFFSMLLCFVLEAIFFWNGIISLYATSVQLGIRERLIGAFCGMIPILNLIVLGRLLRITSKEVDFENEKAEKNAARKLDEVCKTRYPILFVHGVFFRDYKLLNYWGRIPSELKKNGATVFYGNHHSALSIADSAAELTARIKEIVAETGCEKVNIIAHSKGGLDCRYAISCLDAAPYVASLTTINTPHRGCKYADYLLKKAPAFLRRRIEKTYNSTLKKMGDKNPDFIAAVTDLTSERCIKLDKEMIAPSEIRCSSVGSVINHASSGKLPLGLTYYFVRPFDGPNDGLVGADSFEWGDSFLLLKRKGKRGISHGDVIDLNRENLTGFDVREFYVNLVENLKAQGL